MSPLLELDVELALARFPLAVRVESRARTLGVFGPSGSGKTSLLEVLAGWRRPRVGRIAFGGRVWFDARAGVDLPPRARRIGYVPQDALLFPHLDVRANVLAGAARPGGGLVERAIEALELGPLLAQHPRSLSGGERQRVALARALCSEPELLLLDEPLAALDLALRRRVLPWLIRARERFDVPLVFVSHDPTEVQALCEEVCVLDAGRVRDHGAAREVLRRATLGSGGFENVLAGRVRAAGEGTADVELAPGIVFRVPAAGAEPGAELVFALDADDVLLAAERVERVSARNVLPARVERLGATGEACAVEVRLGERGEGPWVSVALTRGAARELELAPGRGVHLLVKTQSCRVLSTGGRGPAGAAAPGAVA